MARTLLDIANEEGRTLPEVMAIKAIKETSQYWNFQNIKDAPAGVSLVDQEVTLPTTDLRDYNANYSDSVAPIVEQVTTPLYALGGKHQIDKKLKAFSQARTGKDYVTDQIRKYSMSIGLNAKKHALFHPSWGLSKWLDVYEGRGYTTKVPLTPVSLNTITIKAFITAMNEAINLGNGTQNLVILCDRQVLNIIHARLISESGVSELAKYFEWKTSTDSNGNALRSGATWGGIPMIDMGYDATRERIIKPVYGAGNETQIFFLNTGDYQSAFLQDRAPEVEIVAQNGVLKEVSVDWAIAFELQDPEAGRVITGLNFT